MNKKLLVALALFYSNALADDYYNKDCDDLYDPFEKVNRKIFVVNDYLDRRIFVPTAKIYNKSVPKAARKSIRNFFNNLYTPVTIINNLLQLKIAEATISFWKFAVNSTIGIGGLYDMSSKMGLYAQKKSFGSTLAFYGARPGAYVMLPFLGPTNMRDMFDVIILDRFLNPITYNIPNETYYPLIILSNIQNRASLLSISNYIEQSSSDKYVTLRSMSHQKRENELDYPQRSKCIKLIE